jgi:hypothetical protein
MVLADMDLISDDVAYVGFHMYFRHIEAINM